MSDGMYEAYADLAALSGWAPCADCGIWCDRDELVEYDGQLWHSHCLPVTMFSVGQQVRVLEDGRVGVVASLGVYAVIVRFPSGVVGFLPRELVRAGGA